MDDLVRCAAKQLRDLKESKVALSRLGRKASLEEMEVVESVLSKIDLPGISSSEAQEKKAEGPKAPPKKTAEDPKASLEKTDVSSLKGLSIFKRVLSKRVSDTSEEPVKQVAKTRDMPIVASVGSLEMEADEHLALQAWMGVPAPEAVPKKKRKKENLAKLTPKEACCKEGKCKEGKYKAFKGKSS